MVRSDLIHDDASLFRCGMLNVSLLRGAEGASVALCAHGTRGLKRPSFDMRNGGQPEAVLWGENQQTRSDHLDFSRQTESDITR